MMRGATKLDEKAQANLTEALNFLEGFLSKTKYAACDHLTLADIVLVSSASTIEVIRLDLMENHELSLLLLVITSFDILGGRQDPIGQPSKDSELVGGMQS